MKLQDDTERNYDMMSEDDDRDIDIESDEDDDDDSGRPTQKSHNSSSQAEKRAHHNALERKRRDHIKDSFTSLREAVPSLQGEKASRAQILKKAAEYIQFMRRKNHGHNQDIEDLKRQNSIIEAQIRQLERTRDTYNGAPESGEMLAVNNHGGILLKSENGHDEDSSEHDELSGQNGASNAGRRNKKLKTNY